MNNQLRNKKDRALQPGDRVCVTGASGYIGSWVAKTFLDAGHPVHATVRDPNDEQKVAHLKRDAGAAGTPLHLYDADLTVPGSFDDAVKGCACVVHVASPFILPDRVKDARKDLIEPAVYGTTNVLEAVNRSADVRRVVLTASVVSMYGDSVDAQGKTVTENDWNTTSTVRHQPYPYSKALAERKAWEIANAQDRWDMVSIHPGFVSGPSRSKRVDASSVMLLKEMLQGKFKSGFPALYFGIVDVREVAEAHYRAAVRADANGRYICAGETLSAIEIADALRAVSGGRYPRLPQKTIPKALLYLAAPFIGFSWKYIRTNVGIPIHFDNHRIQKDLGIEFRPIEQTYGDCIKQLEADRLL